MLGFQGRADPCTGSEPTVLVTTDMVTGSDVVAHVCFPVWINVCCLDVTAQRECGCAAFETAVTTLEMCQKRQRTAWPECVRASPREDRLCCCINCGTQ